MRYQLHPVTPTPPTIPDFAPVKLQKIDKILIEKHQHAMTVFHQNQPLKTYRVALGFSSTGPKVTAKDGKTPEGIYHIIAKNPHSKFNLALKISYPSLTDKKNAAKLHAHPGGDIMIHGLGKNLAHLGQQHSSRDWTLGCVAVSNQEIEELYPYVDIGTLVEIRP